MMVIRTGIKFRWMKKMCNKSSRVSFILNTIGLGMCCALLWMIFKKNEDRFAALDDCMTLEKKQTMKWDDYDK